MSDQVEFLLDELVRLTVLGIRQKMSTQAEAVLALKAAGLETSRIAELLGTTSATVRATKPPKSGASSRKGNGE